MLYWNLSGYVDWSLLQDCIQYGMKTLRGLTVRLASGLTAMVSSFYDVLLVSFRVFGLVFFVVLYTIRHAHARSLEASARSWSHGSGLVICDRMPVLDRGVPCPTSYTCVGTQHLLLPKALEIYFSSIHYVRGIVIRLRRISDR